MSKLLLIILSLIILIGGGYLVVPPLLNNQNNDKKPINLTMWGVNDDPAIVNNVITGYKKLHPNVTINYSTQTLENYRTRLKAQINSGQAADIVAIHNSWMPMFYQTNLLAPAPSEFYGGQYTSSFYKVVADSFVSGGKIYGIPTEIDGLALFYNKDILKGQNIGLPKTWDDVVNAAVLTAVSDKDGNVKTGGLGMGNTKNVDYWSEILGLLYFQQPNADIKTPDNAAGKEVLQFFRNPSGVQKKLVWDQNMDLTTKTFANGKLAFYLGSAEVARQFKTNPNLNFGVMSVPQLPDKNAAFACFWGYGVSSKSKNQKAAWEFLKFLTDAETEKYINEEETAAFGLGRPYPRKDLQNLQKNDSYLGAFVNQGDYYQSFPLCQGTQDNGINDQMIAAFKTAIDSGDLINLSSQISQILASFSTPLSK